MLQKEFEVLDWGALPNALYLSAEQRLNKIDMQALARDVQRLLWKTKGHFNMAAFTSIVSSELDSI